MINADFYQNDKEFVKYGELDARSSIGTLMCLYGLVRMLRPGLAIEIGTHVGDAAVWIARAVAENKHGKFAGYEPNLDLSIVARNRLTQALVCENWVVIPERFEESPYASEPDFVFMDPDPKELYIPCAEKISWRVGAVLAAHDTHLSEPYGDGARALKSWCRDSGKWEIVDLPQERGLMIAHRIAE